VWREGVVHRDIKPENILLAVDGSAKLIDFGLAVQRDRGDLEDCVEMSTPRVGTVAYFAPEQARNAATVDHRADIYSLGATLYHALTGRLPFVGTTAEQMILRHLEEEPVPPRDVVPDLPMSLSTLIVRMMAKNPKARFANAHALLAALAEVQRALAITD